MSYGQKVVETHLLLTLLRFRHRHFETTNYRDRRKDQSVRECSFAVALNLIIGKDFKTSLKIELDDHILLFKIYIIFPY